MSNDKRAQRPRRQMRLQPAPFHAFGLRISLVLSTTQDGAFHRLRVSTGN